jgi:hypothetical protein
LQHVLNQCGHPGFEGLLLGIAQQLRRKHGGRKEERGGADRERKPPKRRNVDECGQLESQKRGKQGARDQIRAEDGH